MKIVPILTAAMIAALGSGNFASASEVSGREYEALYGNWHASAVLGGDVYGASGEQIGNVHDLLVDESGLLYSVVVEVDAFLDSTYVEVGWSEVRFAPGLNSVTLAKSGADVAALDNAETPDFAETAQWRVRAVLGMRAATEAGAMRGTVEDVLFDEATGDLTAFAIAAADGRGLAYVFPPTGADRVMGIEADTLVLPSASRVVVDPEPLEYEEEGL